VAEVSGYGLLRSRLTRQAFGSVDRSSIEQGALQLFKKIENYSVITFKMKRLTFS